MNYTNKFYLNYETQNNLNNLKFLIGFDYTQKSFTYQLPNDINQRKWQKSHKNFNNYHLYNHLTHKNNFALSQYKHSKLLYIDIDKRNNPKKCISYIIDKIIKYFGDNCIIEKSIYTENIHIIYKLKRYISDNEKTNIETYFKKNYKYNIEILKGNKVLRLPYSIAYPILGFYDKNRKTRIKPKLPICWHDEYKDIEKFQSKFFYIKKHYEQINYYSYLEHYFDIKFTIMNINDIINTILPYLINIFNKLKESNFPIEFASNEKSGIPLTYHIKYSEKLSEEKMKCSFKYHYNDFLNKYIFPNFSYGLGTRYYNQYRLASFCKTYNFNFNDFYKLCEDANINGSKDMKIPRIKEKVIRSAWNYANPYKNNTKIKRSINNKHYIIQSSTFNKTKTKEVIKILSYYFYCFKKEGYVKNIQRQIKDCFILFQELYYRLQYNKKNNIHYDNEFNFLNKGVCLSQNLLFLIASEFNLKNPKKLKKYLIESGLLKLIKNNNGYSYSYKKIRYANHYKIISLKRILKKINLILCNVPHRFKRLSFIIKNVPLIGEGYLSFVLLKILNYVDKFLKYRTLKRNDVYINYMFLYDFSYKIRI